MKKIIECIPNFSEGQNIETVDKIVDAITTVPGVFLLDRESDADHNRSVITFAGSPEGVLEAAFQACKTASELINLDNHKGEHPRMGATDVMPLVPIKGVKEAECIEYANKLAERIANELDIPIYLYEKAATRPERENLATVRKGQYEGIKAEIADNPDREPDYGPRKLGPAGATAVGVRAPLIAYNVNLATDNLDIAQTIAKTVRHKSGGFRYVKALGFRLEDKGIVQVSMNLTNYKKTAVHHVFEAIKREAQRYGVNVLESEIIGLIPEKALFGAAKYYLQANEFKNKQVLERQLQKQIEKSSQSLDGFIAEVASKSPAPGGGSVSALAGSLAAALSSMVANLTVTRKKYADVHEEVSATLSETESTRKTLYALIAKDSASYQEVIKAYKSEDQAAIQSSLKSAAAVPMEIAETAVSLLTPLTLLIEKGNPNAITDCGVALYLIETAVKGAILNVKINLKEIEDEAFCTEMRDKCQKLTAEVAEKRTKLEPSIEAGLS